MAFSALRSFLPGLVLSLLPVAAAGLTYVEDVDDAAQPAQERLNRVDRRVAKLATLAQEIYREGEAIGQMIVLEGKPLEATLKDKVKAFQDARNTSTVRAALGEGDAQGLRRHCERAAKAMPRLVTLAGEVGRLGQNHQAAFKAAPLGREGSAPALEAAIDDLQAGLERALDQAQHEQLRSQLKELAQGLPYNYGAYTTLRLVAVQAEMEARQLEALAARLYAAAEKIEKPVADFVADREYVLSVLNALAKVTLDADQKRRHADMQARVNRLRVTAIEKEPPTAHASNARWWADRWRPAAKQASGEVYAAIKPLHDAARQCGEHDDPPRQFADARVAASRSVAHAVNTIDSTGPARVAALEVERRNLAKALATYREVLQQASDKSSTVWRELEATPAASPQRQQVRAQFDRLTSRKKEAQRALEQIPLAQAACQAELEVLKRRLPGVKTLAQKLTALFPKEES